MSHFAWYSPLDGYGKLAVDLDLCRWFYICNYDPSQGIEYGLSYYLTSEGLWIENRSGEIAVQGSDGLEAIFSETYREVDPREVAHEMLSEKRFANHLFPDLEQYREFKDHRVYSSWLAEHMMGSPHLECRSPRMKPVWDRVRLTLSLAEEVCRTYKRMAINQFSILDLFQELGWPPFVNNPLRDQHQLEQTLKDLNKSLRVKDRLQFIRNHSQVGWVLTRRALHDLVDPPS